MKGGEHRFKETDIGWKRIGKNNQTKEDRDEKQIYVESALCFNNCVVGGVFPGIFSRGRKSRCSGRTSA